MNKKIFFSLAFLGLIISGFLLCFQLTKAPLGLTVDEASIGYNSTLISRTFRDETGRFLPVFALTINRSDWKQPVTMYATTIAVKLFGPSLTTIRMVSVVAALISLVLVSYLGYLLLGKFGCLVAGLFFITAPITLMHSHLAQENIMPVPFVLIWLIGIYFSSKKNNPWYLLLSGISLGMGLYSYKGMRAIVPVWAAITILYVFITNTNKFGKKEILFSIKKCLYFIVGILPFIAIIPWLTTHYSGAVFETSNLDKKTFYDFIYPYISSYDISSLFLKGDTTPWHSTGIHGVFLISTLPLFIYGVVKAAKKDKYWTFLLIAFLTAPLLYGQVGSIHRFSRLLVFAPLYALFCTLGTKIVSRSMIGKFMLLVFSILFVINFQDFTQYYWYRYPELVQAEFNANSEDSFVRLAKISQGKNLKPYIYIDNFLAEGQTGKFFSTAYFPDGLSMWKPGDILPENSVVMTRLEKQPHLNQISEPVGKYFYLSNSD